MLNDDYLEQLPRCVQTVREVGTFFCDACLENVNVRSPVIQMMVTTWGKELDYLLALGHVDAMVINNLADDDYMDCSSDEVSSSQEEEQTPLKSSEHVSADERKQEIKTISSDSATAQIARLKDALSAEQKHLKATLAQVKTGEIKLDKKDVSDMAKRLDEITNILNGISSGKDDVDDKGQKSERRVSKDLEKDLNPSKTQEPTGFLNRIFAGLAKKGKAEVEPPKAADNAPKEDKTVTSRVQAPLQPGKGRKRAF